MLAFLPVILRFFYDYESEYVSKFQKPFNELQAAVSTLQVCVGRKYLSMQKGTLLLLQMS